MKEKLEYFYKGYNSPVLYKRWMEFKDENSTGNKGNSKIIKFICNIDKTMWKELSNVIWDDDAGRVDWFKSTEDLEENQQELEWEIISTRNKKKIIPEQTISTVKYLE